MTPAPDGGPLPAGLPAPAGLSVHRRAGAPAGAPVVVCVHGAADRGAAFARVGRYLPDVDLVRLDRRGYGRSSVSATADGRGSGGPGGAAVDGVAALEAQVDDVVAVLDWALDQHAGPVPAVVCGHSHGGLLALGAALADARVSGVVAWEPPMPWASWWSSGRAAATADGADPAGDDPAGDDPAGDAMESFLRRMIGAERYAALPASVRAARRAEGPALLADLAAAGAAGALPLAALRIPVVLGVGGATSGRHRRAVEEFASVLEWVEVVEVADADHGAHLTHPAAVADAVTRCLAMVGQVG